MQDTHFFVSVTRVPTWLEWPAVSGDSSTTTSCIPWPASPLREWVYVIDLLAKFTIIHSFIFFWYLLNYNNAIWCGFPQFLVRYKHIPVILLPFFMRLLYPIRHMIPNVWKESPSCISGLMNAFTIHIHLWDSMTLLDILSICI